MTDRTLQQIATLREAAHLRALQRMPTSIRDQTKRAAFVAYAHREELAKRHPQIAWLERKLRRTPTAEAV